MTFSFRTLASVILGALLLALGIAAWAHHKGVVTGQITQKITTDRKSLQVAKQATAEATVNQEKFNERVEVAHAKTTTAREALAPIRAKVQITPHSVTVDGDTSAAVVIPALVQVIRYQDTLQMRSDSELKAQQFRHVADTVTSGAAKYQAQIAEELSHDIGDEKSPRCGRTCGIAIGVGSVALALFGLHQLGLRF